MIVKSKSNQYFTDNGLSLPRRNEDVFEMWSNGKLMLLSTCTTNMSLFEGSMCGDGKRQSGFNDF